MTIREASFGGLFKVGFWVMAAPGLFFLFMLALGATAVFGLAPALLQDVSTADFELEFLGREGGPSLAIGFTWMFAGLYAAVFTVFAAFTSAIGAVILVLWRAIFMRSAD